MCDARTGGAALLRSSEVDFDGNRNMVAAGGAGCDPPVEGSDVDRTNRGDEVRREEDHVDVEQGRRSGSRDGASCRTPPDTARTDQASPTRCARTSRWAVRRTMRRPIQRQGTPPRRTVGPGRGRRPGSTSIGVGTCRAGRTTLHGVQQRSLLQSDWGPRSACGREPRRRPSRVPVAAPILRGSDTERPRWPT